MLADSPALITPAITTQSASAASAHGHLNRRDTTRISTALGYLEMARDRSNLTVRPRSLVSRLLFDGNQAVGAELANGERVSGKRIVLAAGAIGTPAILLRSGIGPAKDLGDLGIRVR